MKYPALEVFVAVRQLILIRYLTVNWSVPMLTDICVQVQMGSDQYECIANARYIRVQDFAVQQQHATHMRLLPIACQCFNMPLIIVLCITTNGLLIYHTDQNQ